MVAASARWECPVIRSATRSAPVIFIKRCGKHEENKRSPKEFVVWGWDSVQNGLQFPSGFEPAKKEGDTLKCTNRIQLVYGNWHRPLCSSNNSCPPLGPSLLALFERQSLKRRPREVAASIAWLGTNVLPIHFLQGCNSTDVA